MGVTTLPEGPVTIMFTDIEGSTALRTSLGDAETNALFRRHDELVKEQIEAHQGYDQGAALGDGFLSVFVSTRRAVACAIGIQKALDSFNRSRSGPPLNVRIGLNTGEVAWQDDQLSGEAVHAAARVCAAGSGGQILVSDVTRQLAGTVPDVTFHDAGEFHLKGFPQPWRLFDVVWVRETSSLPEQVFVGREAELALLRGKLASALKGHGGLVLIGGEPGVGKTTLAKQLVVEAGQRGALAVFGRCYESEGTVPYSPFVEMLEQALSLMPPGIVREDLGEDAPEVARLLPELRRRFPDIGEPLDLPPEQQRHYFFNAVASFIARGAARFPLLLVMDDVHWADEPTLLLIEHMAALLPEIRVLGVGTYRDVELDVARPLAATMERLLRNRIMDRISVKRFDRTTVATMLQALAGKPAPEAVVGAVFEETEGNPFFVEEVFRHLVEEGKLLDGGEFREDITIDELDVPESVRLVVGRRLERLGAEAQRVLAAGAVVGKAFPFRLLREVAGVESGRLVDIVDEAEVARVVVPEQRNGEVHYSFAHELIRQTLLSSVSMLRRQHLHLAVADAIERTDKRAREQRPSEIATHLLQAGAAADSARTLEYLELAVQRAVESAAFEEAIRAIDDALSVTESDDKLRTARLLEQQGWANRALGRFEQCIAIWDDVVTTYAECGLIEEAATLCWETGYQYAWLSRFDDAFAGYSRGLSIAGDHRTAARSLLVGASGAVMGAAGFFEQAQDQLHEAESIARELDDARALGRALFGWTVYNHASCRYADGITSGMAAIEQLRRANDQWTLVDALAWTSLQTLFGGGSTMPVALAEEGAELGARLGHRSGEALARRVVALAEALVDADLDQFETFAERDREGYEAIHSPFVSQSFAWQAASQILRGNLDEAVRLAEQAIAVEPASAYTGIGWCYKFLARAFAQDADSCRRLLEEKRDQLPRPGERASLGRTATLMYAAHGCVVAGLDEDAANLYPLVAENAGAFPIGMFELAIAERIAGMAAAAGRRWDEAIDHFERALEQSVEFRNRLDAPQVAHWYGKMLLDRGRPEDESRGEELLTSAVDAYSRIGMPLHGALAREILASRR